MRLPRAGLTSNRRGFSSEAYHSLQRQLAKEIERRKAAERMGSALEEILRTKTRYSFSAISNMQYTARKALENWRKLVPGREGE